MNYFAGLSFIFLISIVTIFGDVLMKLAGNSNKYIDVSYLSYGMFLYLITGIGWFFAMKYVELSSIGTIYGLTTAILLTLIGFFFFRENINIIEFIGIMMGVVSIFLLTRFAS